MTLGLTQSMVQEAAQLKEPIIYIHSQTINPAIDIEKDREVYLIQVKTENGDKGVAYLPGFMTPLTSLNMLILALSDRKPGIFANPCNN